MDGQSGSHYFEFEEDALYTECIKNIFVDEKEADAKLSALTFTIANIPTDFPQIPGTNLHRAILKGNPRVGIWYSFDGAKITFRFAEIIGPQEEYSYEET